MMTEAHVHALANLKNIPIVVISPECISGGVKRLAPFIYEPGWKLPREAGPAALKQYLCAHKAHVIMYSGTRKHYCAMLPCGPTSCNAVDLLLPARPRRAKKGEEGNSIVID